MIILVGAKGCLQELFGAVLLFCTENVIVFLCATENKIKKKEKKYKISTRNTERISERGKYAAPGSTIVYWVLCTKACFSIMDDEINNTFNIICKGFWGI